MAGELVVITTARLLGLGTLLFAGCTQQPPPEAASPSAAVVAVGHTPGANTPDSPKQLPPGADAPGSPLAQTSGADAPGSPKQPEPAEFEYPADLGGKAVARAVAPRPPAAIPVERIGATPKPRPAPPMLLNPDTFARTKYVLPPVMLAKSAGVKLVPPSERVPPDLGRGANAVPARPILPVAAVVTERSRDVNLPPALPTLGRPLADRVSHDDPTAEFATAAIVAPTVKVLLAPAPFVKMSVPDPFELGAQVKPKIPPAAEPGLTPVVVDPKRAK